MTTPTPTTAFAAPPPEEAVSGQGQSGAGTTSRLSGQHVLILGLGASGLAMARWCARAGARVTVADTRAAPPQLAALQQELPAARFVTGAFEAALVEGADLHAVFKSPGLTPLEVAAVAGAARAKGIGMGGELGLFSEALAELRATRDYQPKVLAVTGTNGKTTVTSLAAHLVGRSGKSVALAGNIGPTLLDTLAARLDADALPEVWVIELSSFQLDTEHNFEPSAAAVLNITQDHLDWHGSTLAAGPPQGENAPSGGSAAHKVASVGAAMTAYGAAKARIFGRQGLPVLNRDDPLVMGLLSAAEPAQAAKRADPVRAKPQRPQSRSYVTFGADRPTRPGDFGLEEVNGMLWLVRALEADETLKKRKGDEEELHVQRLMPADALRIRGRHNALNALAALALCLAADCALGAMLYGLREYRGEPHRLESVGVFDEVEFFDDSKGTNVGATVAALSGLGPERKLVVILGGVGKGQDFSPLAPAVARWARAVVLIGQDAPLIRAALQDTGVPLLEAASMAQAVAQARAQARAGDAVLMSPACASFDMFDNYQHRAWMFVQAVGEIAGAAGAVMEGTP